VWTTPLQIVAVDRLLPAAFGQWWNLPGPGAALRWLLAFVLVVLPASFMGATLPVLCRALTRDEKSIGKVFGALYGINTIGAVLGVLAAGYWLILYLGVVSTIRIGCLLNLVAGFGALALSVALGEGKVGIETPEKAGPLAKKKRSSSPLPFPTLIVMVIFCSGFTALAYEILWIRYFVFFLGSNILSFSMVLGTLLLALGIGSLGFGWLVRSRKVHLTALGWIQLALGPIAGLTVLLFLRAETVIGLLEKTGSSGDLLSSLAGRSLLTAVVLFLPGLLMGAVLPAATGVLSSGSRTCAFWSAGSMTAAIS
jgi:spermidine synthase